MPTTWQGDNALMYISKKINTPEVKSLKEAQADNIRALLHRLTKSKLASELNIQNTQTLDQWLARNQVPTKYHLIIEGLIKTYGDH